MNKDYIYHVRLTLELTQEELATQLGWTGARHISRLESGERPVNKQTILAIECLLRRDNKLADFLIEYPQYIKIHP